MAELSRAVLPIMRLAGKMLLPFYGNIEILMRKNDERRSVVTKLDQDVERFLAKQLHEIDQGIEFVGEEFGGDRSAERYWLCDPIDGTTQFIEGMLGCTSMLALVVGEKVVFSVIYDFVRDEMFYGEEGIGAFCNGEGIHVRERPGRYLAGFESNLSKPANARKKVDLERFAQVFRTGNAGDELTKVARGDFAGRICLDPFGKDYDFAAGAFLVAQAGGKVANIGTHAYDFRQTNFIAAHPSFYRVLTEGAAAPFPVNC